MTDTVTLVIPPEMVERMLANCIAIGLVKLEADKRYLRTMQITPAGLEVTWEEMREPKLIPTVFEPRAETPAPTTVSSKRG